MDEDLKELLKNYITKEELRDLFVVQRSASEQFLEDHDRNFRSMEKQMGETQQQVRDAVHELKAGLSKLGIMSDALSNIMRLQNDNYESIRATQREHSERLSKLEQNHAIVKEEYLNLYGSIYGDSSHPDQESLAALIKNRYIDAKAEHLETMARFDHLESRQDNIEKQIEQFRRAWTFLLQGVGNAFKATIPKVLKWGLAMLVVFIAARIGDAGLMNQVGEFIKMLFGVK